MTSLVAVRAALKVSDSEQVSQFTSLIDGGSVAPYKSKENARSKLGSNGVDYPTLGKKQAPSGLRKAPSLKVLREICLRDLPEARQYLGHRLLCFEQSGNAGDSLELDEDMAGMQTIDSLVDTDVAATGTIVTFPSESLEELWSKDWEAPNNLLRASMATCTVLPNNTFLPLHHSNEGTTITTQLSGSVVWVVWPPTDSNLRTLQTAYGNFAEDPEAINLSIAESLEGGMIFAQTEGDGLRLPPFTLIAGLAITTSVLTSQSHVTAEDFIRMLRKLPLLKAWFQTELDGQRKQSEFNASCLLYLELMLNGDPENEDRNSMKLPIAKNGLLSTLLKVWDNIKNDLAAMMGPADGKTMENIWEAFLTEAVGRECPLCNKRVTKVERKKHFLERHWPEAKETERTDSMEALDEDFDVSEGTISAGDDEGVHAEDDGTMELDM
jgi:hypothetical protein